MEHMCFNFSEEVGYSDWQLPLGCHKVLPKFNLDKGVDRGEPLSSSIVYRGGDTCTRMRVALKYK